MSGYYDDGFDDDDDVDFETNGVEENPLVPELANDDIDANQGLLLSYLVGNPTLWKKAGKIIDPEYFQSELKTVVKFIQEFIEKYKRMPPREIIRAETQVELLDPPMIEDPRIMEYICNKTEEFCRYNATTNFLVNASEIISTDRSRATVGQLHKEMKKLTQISLQNDLGFEVHEGTREALLESRKDDGISTGYDLFDRALNGGTTRPSFNIVSAGSGDGKSIMLSNLAINYAERGLNVIFYTLELQPAMVRKRFNAMMTGYDLNKIYESIDDVDQQMINRGQNEGKIWIKKLPMVGTTPADIANHYQDLSMETGEVWHVVCIDYLDLLYPIEKVRADNIHMKDKLVSQELNDWFHDNHLIGWSAAQQKKDAQDEKIVTRGSTSGGADKVFTADNVLVGKRNDEDRLQDLIWYTFTKTRSSGGVGQRVPMIWDPKSQRITDGSYDMYVQANPVLSGKKANTRLSKDPLMRETGRTDSVVAKTPSQTRIDNTRIGILKHFGKG